MTNKINISFFALFFIINCIAQESIKLPNDTRWVTSSEEYKAVCQQTYINAWSSIRSQVLKHDEPVIVMDLDETVLDNSKYQIELFNTSKVFNPRSWNKWVKKEVANLVPGAKDFILNYKKKKKAKIIYISNRDASTLLATKSNMKKLGIYFDDDVFLLRESKNDTKVIRRNEVLFGKGRMEKYGPKNVIAYFGDAMGDFPEDNSYFFSINKFIFPNPMYGKW